MRFEYVAAELNAACSDGGLMRIVARTRRMHLGYTLWHMFSWSPVQCFQVVAKKRLSKITNVVDRSARYDICKQSGWRRPLPTISARLSERFRTHSLSRPLVIHTYPVDRPKKSVHITSADLQLCLASFQGAA